jgi:hypothetical protein
VTISQAELLDRITKSLEVFQVILDPYDGNKMLSFADSYNSTRSLVVALNPSLDSHLPPSIHVKKHPAMDTWYWHHSKISVIV